MDSIKETLKLNSLVFVNKSKRIHTRRKYWWSPTIQIYHQDACRAYINFKKTIDNPLNYTNEERLELQLVLKEAKRNFRRDRRIADKLKKDIGLQRLNSYFHLSKEMFWKKVAELKKKKKNIHIPIDVLQDHYSELFNSTNNLKPDETKKAEKKIADFFEKYKNETFNIKITPSEIRGLLNELGNGKSLGHMGLSNEHLKYCDSNYLGYILTMVIWSIYNSTKLKDPYRILQFEF